MGPAGGPLPRQDTAGRVSYGPQSARRWHHRIAAPAGRNVSCPLVASGVWRMAFAGTAGIRTAWLPAAWLLALLIGLAAPAGPARATGPGPVTDWQRTPHGLAGHTATHRFELEAWSGDTVRVRIAPKGAPRRHSYSLVDDSPPAYRGARVRSAGDRLALETPALRVELLLRPALRVRLLTAGGELLNEDAAGEALGLDQRGEAFTLYKSLQEGERFVGLGEALGDLDRRGTLVRLRNTDNYRYDDPRVPMYASIPFYMGLHHGRVYGLYFDNTHAARFDFGASSDRLASIHFEGGELDEFLMAGTTPADILRSYSALTGRMPMPPRWALGFQQSRCSYYPESEVRFIASAFRAKRIPLDGIVLDADYLHGYEPFRIDARRFPDMAGLAKELRAQGIELTASVNPGIAIDDGYDAYRSGLAQDVFLRHADGTPYVASMWPNTIRLPDFTSARVRAWWSAQLAQYERLGIHGTWTDMNEPAIGGQSMPDAVRFDFDGQGADAGEAHNLYGMLMARASYEAPALAGSARRPFVLSRAGHAGIQRYAAMWSGDNQAKDSHVLLGTLLVSQMGLAGVPLTGADIGGYIGDGNKALYRRWIEIGALMPYMRAHREHSAAANEPWGYGEEDEAIARSYIGLRYRLMPYLYSVVHEAATSGMPIARSLVFAEPFEPRVYEREFQYEFMLGDALLANPLSSDEDHKRSYLPAGEWYDLYTDERHAGGAFLEASYPAHKLPLLVRASSIVPMQRELQSTRDDPGDTLDVHVYAGSESHRFDYYEDDGETEAWRAGDYSRRAIEFLPAERRLHFARAEGRRQARFTRLRVVLHGFPPLRGIHVNGAPAEARSLLVRPFDPLAALDEVYYDPDGKRALHAADAMPPQQVLELGDAPELDIRWQ